MILLKDNFSGTVINPSKWTVTNPNSVFSQNNNLILALPHAATFGDKNIFTNNLTSTSFITSGVAVAQANLTWGTDGNNDAIGGIYLWKDSNNFASIFSRASTAGNYRCIIYSGGSSVYDFNSTITKGKDVKIVTNGTTISFWYWNSTTWTQIDITQTYSLGYNLYLLINGADNTTWNGANPVNIDNLYFSNTDYNTNYPNSNTNSNLLLMGVS